MFKMTEIELELMYDVDMFHFIEKGMREGISFIAHRHGQANNKYMQNYNPKEASKYLMYLDANIVMCQPLPTGGFKRTDGESRELLDQNSERGLILEVELEYPKELHHLHNGYSCAAEKNKD